jgi:hypothetical protein
MVPWPFAFNLAVEIDCGAVFGVHSVFSWGAGPRRCPSDVVRDPAARPGPNFDSTRSSRAATCTHETSCLRSRTACLSASCDGAGRAAFACTRARGQDVRSAVAAPSMPPHRIVVLPIRPKPSLDIL